MNTSVIEGLHIAISLAQTMMRDTQTVQRFGQDVSPSMFTFNTGVIEGLRSLIVKLETSVELQRHQ